jgi:hypothetical protein
LAILNSFNPSDIVRLLLGTAVAAWSVLIVLAGVTGVIFVIAAITKEHSEQEPFTYALAVGLIAGSCWFGAPWVRALLVGLAVILLIVVVLLRLESPILATVMLITFVCGIVIHAIPFVAHYNGMPVWRSMDIGSLPGLLRMIDPLKWSTLAFVALIIAVGVKIRVLRRRYTPSPSVWSDTGIASDGAVIRAAPASDRSPSSVRRAYPGYPYTSITDSPSASLEPGVGIGFLTAALVAFAFAAVGSTPWVQPEQITSASFEGSGYILSTADGWSTFLSYSDRTVHFIKSDSITKRLICQPKRKREIEVDGYAVQRRNVRLSRWVLDLPLIARDSSSSISIGDSNSKPDPIDQKRC